MTDWDAKISRAVMHFWQVRRRQSKNQGRRSGRRDSGLRTAVTGGKHLDGFVRLCRELLVEAGIADANVFWQDRRELPGYFRAEKSWDLVAVVDKQLLCVLEFKGMVGPSFGNNFNNRAEEALGNATDFWTAYREGAFGTAGRPWLGYVFILEECQRSMTPVKTSQPHFSVLPEFRSASYVERYSTLLTKLLRERLYDGASLILTPANGGLQGDHRSPTRELSFHSFATALYAHALAFGKLRS